MPKYRERPRCRKILLEMMSERHMCLEDMLKADMLGGGLIPQAKKMMQEEDSWWIPPPMDPKATGDSS